ncbi:MAG: sigma 54-interacting transcriptional regulator [Gammaproteobacteria bacterium]|nr:sigma 54-interacting transcriptional regulator [Gammaproteobacteria bacterium]
MSATDRYQQFFRRSPALLVALDRDGYFVDATDAWLERFGYVRDEIDGLRPQDLASEASLRRIVEDYLPLLRRAGQLSRVPVDLLTKTGERVGCLASAVIERSADGEHIGTLVGYAELGEEADLEKNFTGLYRDTPAMLHAVDRNGRIVHVNERWLMKLGYRREEVVGRLVTDFMSADGRAPDEQSVSDIISQGELDNEPRSYVKKNGEILEALVSARADRDKAGQVTFMYVAIKDVTDRNNAERQLRAAFEENARLREELERERDYLREEVQVSMNFGRIVGESPVLKKMLAQLEAVAQTSASVLIHGESGVGKELVAHALHSRSPRADGPLVKVNCASIPRELFESEFFGHVRGAFTGAHRDRVGRFELAHGGTLFLDEIGEIPVELQGKLLRVLQEGEYERIGDDRTRSVDVRLVAATNRDLEALVKQGGFREDLFYRLSVFPIQVPALRERGDDVVQLASHFVDRVCKDFGRAPLRLSKQQVELLKSYAWPGNIRELKNVIERAVILSSGKVLRLDLAMADIASTAGAARHDADETGPDIMTEKELLALQKENMLAALEIADWRVSGPNGAATLVGLKPTTFTDRMRKFRLSKPRRSSVRAASSRPLSSAD